MKGGGFMPRSAQSALLQVLEGNPNNKTKKELKKRQKAEKEMLVSAENMTSPSWLDKTAQKEFSRVVDLFKDTTLLNEADIFTIAQYADLTSEFISCTRRLRKNGKTIGGKPNPDLRLKLQLSAEIDKVTKTLGLTPAARASLAIAKSNIEDDHTEGDDDF